MEKLDRLRLRIPVVLVFPTIELMKKCRHGIEWHSADDEEVRADGAGFLHMAVHEGVNVVPAFIGDPAGQAIGGWRARHMCIINTFIGEAVLI